MAMRERPRFCYPLNQPGAAHTAEAILADDDMVMHGYSELFPRIGNVARHRDILAAGRTVPAGMIVDKNNCRCAKVHRATDNFTRVNGCLVDRALARHLIADQHVFAVEIERAYALNRQMRHVGAQIIQQRLP